MLVTCQECGIKDTDKKDMIRIDDKNFHKHCAKQYEDKKMLCDTICRIFDFKAPGPRNYAYIKKFKQDGMTYSGMTGALVYFYDIKKNSTENSNGGIGIIPWVYEEARSYFRMEEERKKSEKERLEQVDKVINKEKEIRYVTAQKRVAPVHTFHSAEEFEW